MEVLDKVLAVIPARGGSKGVLRKNIRPVCGKPLIAYSIETALASRHLIHRIIVSTDDEEIAEVARHYGAEVPFLRPAELACDNTPMVPVLQHAVQFVEQHDKVRLDWVCLLQPTEPFRTVEDIEEALRLAQQTGLPVVNVGNRQAGRDRGPNVFDVDYDKKLIIEAVRRHLANGRYPSSTLYGGGHAGERIADLLAKVPLRIEKRITY